MAENYKNGSIVSVDMDKVGVMAAYSDPLCVCVVHCIFYNFNCIYILYILSISWIIKCLIIIDARYKHEDRSERENQQDATVRCLFLTISQHVSGIIMPIFRRTSCMLLHVLCCAGSAGCGW